MSHQGDQAKAGRTSKGLAYAGKLAGELIHEIRNPLNSLSLNLQLLAEDWQEAETPRERRALKRIKRLQSEAERLSATLDDFLGFVRGHRLNRTACDINDLVEEVLAFIRPEMEMKNIELRSSYKPLPRCRADIDLAKQALLNLLLNAEQACSDTSAREIMVRTEPAGDRIRIDVIDTGKGIAPAEEERIFDAFFSTRKGGTGLGLPMTRRIVEEHGGEILVHSDLGRGTCFSIFLPTQAEQPSSEENRTSDAGKD